MFCSCEFTHLNNALSLSLPEFFAELGCAFGNKEQAVTQLRWATEHIEYEIISLEMRFAGSFFLRQIHLCCLFIGRVCVCCGPTRTTL